MAVMTDVAVALAAFVLMEPFTAWAHRAVMHGRGMVLHRSHHRRMRPGRRERWEANDWFPVMFAGVVMIGFAVGFNVPGMGFVVPVGVGVTVYGVAYAFVHDVYIHRRVPLFGDRTVPVLERLAEAHREHHRGNAAPYGMLVPVRSGSRPSHVPVES